MNTVKEQLKSAKELVKEGKNDAAFSLLQSIARPEHDYSLQVKYCNTYEKIIVASLSLTPIRIAVVGTSTLDQFGRIFKTWLGLIGVEAEIFIAPYDTMDQSVLDPTSSLYAFKPDVIWLFSNYRDFLAYAPSYSDADSDVAVNDALERFENLWNAIRQNSDAFIIQNNCDLPLTRVFGNFSSSVPWGESSYLRAVNSELPQRLPKASNVFDLDYCASLFGKNNWCDERMWFLAKNAFSLDALGSVAHQGATLIRGLKGKSRKCVVLDLDNTLWGGVIGDDGMDGIRLGSGAEGEAFVAFQEYVLSLKKRGVVLCVCSKNNEENAKQPFEEHPDMILGLDDIAVFVANWENKADNIREIAETLGLGLDSLVFVDDNPAERMLVKEMLPMVAVPEMPADPAYYVRTLDAERYFETVAFSVEDSARGDMYKGNAQRKTLQKRFSDLSGFLESLNMEAIVSEFDDFHLPRISQLVNRSNQFHLTTTRYTESQIRAFMDSDHHECLYFKLRDRFGDNGLISLLILERDGADLCVDTWVMSCRVLSRGMEYFVFEEVAKLAQSLGVERVIGKYIPSKKNSIVADLYEKLGFVQNGQNGDALLWELPLAGVEMKEHKITKIDSFE